MTYYSIFTRVFNFTPLSFLSQPNFFLKHHFNWIIKICIVLYNKKSQKWHNTRFFTTNCYFLPIIAPHFAPLSLNPIDFKTIQTVALWVITNLSTKGSGPFYIAIGKRLDFAEFLIFCRSFYPNQCLNGQLFDPVYSFCITGSQKWPVKNLFSIY